MQEGCVLSATKRVVSKDGRIEEYTLTLSENLIFAKNLKPDVQPQPQVEDLVARKREAFFNLFGRPPANKQELETFPDDLS